MKFIEFLFGGWGKYESVRVKNGWIGVNHFPGAKYRVYAKVVLLPLRRQAFVFQKVV